MGFCAVALRVTRQVTIGLGVLGFGVQMLDGGLTYFERPCKVVLTKNGTFAMAVSGACVLNNCR